jgi:hypothetical protein
MTDDDEDYEADCRSEIWSWDYFRHQQVDPYWMRCQLAGPHKEHENTDTEARWTE